MIRGEIFSEQLLDNLFTNKGKEFILGKRHEQNCLGIVKEAIDIHCNALNIPEQLIKNHYFDIWANWKPGNVTDLYVYADDEVKKYCKNARLGEKYKRKGLFLYLAAKYNFRCYYTGVPLLPLRQEIFCGNIFKCSEHIPQMYAWYPSVDHLDSVTTDEEKRHSMENLLIVGHEVNRMFGSIDRKLILDLMHYIIRQNQLPKELSIDIGKHSIIRSSRKRR